MENLKSNSKKEEEKSGTSDAGPSFGPVSRIEGVATQPSLSPQVQVTVHKGSRLQMAGESIKVGTIYGRRPLEPMCATWELLDEECSIAMVARREALDREKPIGPGKSEEEWDRWVQNCEEGEEYNAEEPTLQGLRPRTGQIAQ